MTACYLSHSRFNCICCTNSQPRQIQNQNSLDHQQRCHMPSGVRIRNAALRTAIHQRHQQHQIDADQRQCAAHVNPYRCAAAGVGAFAARVLPIRTRHAGNKSKPVFVCGVSSLCDINGDT